MEHSELGKGSRKFSQMIEKRKIIVRGNVQGVGFRFHAKRKADEMGVKGFVQNKDNGEVYIEAESNADTLDRFVDWCRVGPDHALIRGVKVEKDKPEGFSGFLIT